MITRVRARLQSVSATSSKTNDPKEQEERTAQTVCLLSVVLLLPYLARIQHSSLLVGSVGLAYTCLVIPMVVSANYKYPMNALRQFFIYSRGMLVHWLQPVKWVLMTVYMHLDRCERCYMKMNNISNMINQLVFFMLCDRILVPGQRVTCLYSLMFYNVIAYCVGYIKELVEKEDWSPYVNLTKNSEIRHLAMSATKIVLEWTKAVTFIITVVFMLLVFGLEQGLEHYHPTWSYITVTWIYYMTTEKIFIENFPSLLTLCHLELLESLEALWAPVILKCSTCVLSFIFTLPLLLYGHFRFFLFALYANVYLSYKDISSTSLSALNLERAVLSQYRHATSDELNECDDVCAVCLSPMKMARVTPCHHMFHGECLRLCLKTSNQCPICKREFRFE